MYSKRLVEASNGGAYLSNRVPSPSKSALFFNWPSITRGEIITLLSVVLFALRGGELFLMVHEFRSQGIRGRVVIMALSLFAKKVFHSCPTVLEQNPMATLRDRKCLVLAQGPNLDARRLRHNESSGCPEPARNTLLLFGSIGNFSPGCLLDVLRAYREVAMADPRFCIQWFGSGASRETVIKQFGEIASVVKILPMLTDEQCLDILRSSVVACFPFRDGASIRRSSLLSAIASGVNCIATCPKNARETDFFSSARITNLIFVESFQNFTIPPELLSIQNRDLDEFDRVFSYCNTWKVIEDSSIPHLT